MVGGIRAGRRTAVLLVYGLCVALAPFIYKYYLGILALGVAPEGSQERQDYDKLRASLAGGNLAARLYAKWLTAFLDGVERFFSDAGMADRTLFPRAFWLRKPSPLWTAPAFDRCMLLAFGLSSCDDFRHLGHFGPCRPGGGGDRPATERPRLVEKFSGSGSLRAPGRESPVLIVVAIAGACAAAGTFAVGVIDPRAWAAAGAVAVTIAFIVAVTIAFIVAGAVAFAGAGAGMFAAAFILVSPALAVALALSLSLSAALALSPH